MRAISRGILNAILAALVMTGAANAQAQVQAQAQPQVQVEVQDIDTDLGRSEFLKSCASCHGASGKGDGPVASSLKRQPSDLTKLSERNNGVFPISRIYAVIDGRIQIMIHGPREMPVWGDNYTVGMVRRMPRDFMSKELADALVRVRILTLIEYLSTLQGK